MLPVFSDTLGLSFVIICSFCVVVVPNEDNMGRMIEEEEDKNCRLKLFPVSSWRGER